MVSISTVVYIIISLLFIYGILKKRDGGGGYFSGLEKLPNALCLIGLILFTLIFGGIFWW